MIELKGVTKQYKGNIAVVSNIDVTIEHGMFGLLGPNGAGKSTLLRMLATLQKPTTGTICVNGMTMENDAHRIRGVIGYLPQSFQAQPLMTGREFLDYVALMKGFSHTATRKRMVDKMLEEVNLTAKAKDKIKTYSGGMRQRLGIAQAMIGDPSVLIVDEPTAGLDPEERVRFRNLLNRFSNNRIVVLSTHIVADIETSCDQLAVLNQGELQYVGHPEGLAAHAEGKVWQVKVSDEQFVHIQPDVLVSAKRLDRGVLCRIVSVKKPAYAEAIAVAPSLEDGYLALLGGAK
ncbi:ABC transporter ATP-binding protein [Paenibacillus assamensis]|uniref:ABC transporter ATP-binding protein n=1 Tax=Paenibacillus assamensis TaxID=311244 RepID=UPI00041E5E08|nr:ABC transporter ATP-binding protein [Paenibacillus assamensis]